MMRRLIILMVAVLGMFGSDAFAIYDAGTGRFMQRDPIGYNGGSMNLYQYVLSSPAKYLDPLGLDVTDPSDDDFRYNPGSGTYTYPPMPGPSTYTTSPGSPVPWPDNPDWEKWKAPIYLCSRDLNSSGAEGAGWLLIEAENLLFSHRYLHFGDPKPGGPVDGYGLYNTRKKKGARPDREKNVGGLSPENCGECYRSSGVLKHGSGAGKTGRSASNEEIRDCIKNTRLSQDYDTVDYNCRDWADEAARDCGLECKGPKK